MKIAYHTWHQNEINGLHNWILCLDKTKDAAKVKKLENVINRIKIRKLLIKAIESEDDNE